MQIARQWVPVGSNLHLASQQEKSAASYKRSKKILTIMACSNASGKHKCPLMIIGKSRRSRVLKDISPNVLTMCYKSQKSVCMDTNLFTTWFKEEFVPAVIILEDFI
ncbi:hypothetical protein Trydic_g9962 [Trypoxylus dichotomus]